MSVPQDSGVIVPGEGQRGDRQGLVGATRTGWQYGEACPDDKAGTETKKRQNGALVVIVEGPLRIRFASICMLCWCGYVESMMTTCRSGWIDLEGKRARGREKVRNGVFLKRVNVPFVATTLHFVHSTDLDCSVGIRASRLPKSMVRALSPACSLAHTCVLSLDSTFSRHAALPCLSYPTEVPSFSNAHMNNQVYLQQYPIVHA